MPVDEFVRSRPGPRLRTSVDWFSGYRQLGVPPARHRGLPSPALTLILTLDDPLLVASSIDAAGPVERFDAMLAGLHLRPALVVHEGRQSGIQIAVSPLAARRLFGLPAGELAGLDVDPAELIGAARVDRIRAGLLERRGWPARLALLDAELARLDASDREPPPEVRYAWQRLRSSGGRVPVGALAAETGWSARHLGARFRLETGLSPKEAARVIRFDLARRALAVPSRPSIAGIAAEHGFADQSHLVREFQALAGCAPSTWIAEEFRNIQDGHWSPPRDSSP